MDNQKPLQTRLKPGPRPLGDQALTPTERKRRSRQKLVADGDAEFMLRLPRDKLEIVDFFAIANGVTRSDIIAGLLEMAFAKSNSALSEAVKLQAAGCSEVEIIAKIRQHLGTADQMTASK